MEIHIRKGGVMSSYNGLKRHMHSDQNTRLGMRILVHTMASVLALASVNSTLPKAQASEPEPVTISVSTLTTARDALHLPTFRITITNTSGHLLYFGYWGVATADFDVVVADARGNIIPMSDDGRSRLSGFKCNLSATVCQDFSSGDFRTRDFNPGAAVSDDLELGNFYSLLPGTHYISVRFRSNVANNFRFGFTTPLAFYVP